MAIAQPLGPGIMSGLPGWERSHAIDGPGGEPIPQRSQSTVTRWIKQRGLPSQHVNGQFRFNRAELLEWATANQIKVSVEMFDHLETDDEPVPSLAEALEAGGIF